MEFEGSYPIGNVWLSDTDIPIAIQLEAFSPFIPLEAGDSGLPATVLHYRFSNVSAQQQDFSVGAWLGNAVLPFDPKPEGKRINEVYVSPTCAVLHCRAELATAASADGWGSMSLALLGQSTRLRPRVDASNDEVRAHQLFEDDLPVPRISAEAPTAEPLVGGMATQLSLAPGESVELHFVVSWHFPQYSGGKVFFSTMENIPNLSRKRRFYATQFKDSLEVARYVERNLKRLAATTREWVATWYDSTLPRWFLDRTFINTSILATQTAHRFEDGRFYGWEGVDSCPGTCQHVWQYAQAAGTVFPELERLTREHVDYGIAYHDDGSMDYRAEASSHGDQAVAPSEAIGEAISAVDGAAGTIIRVLREHKHSSDLQFLRRLWPRVRKSIEFLMRLDRDGDGLLEGPQYNTLDATWYGKIPWISSLYLAALAAGKQMALDMNDEDFASRCEEQLAVGRRSFVEQLFNGRYFEHVGDTAKPTKVDLQEGCYIDQVLGQSFAHQVGMERVVSHEHSVAALKSLWRYNFATDVGPYREGFTGVIGGRWYAMPGEAGMIMCTWPQAPYDPSGRLQADIGLGITSEGYLNECMTGFEYQVAAHMLAEGMVYEGLSLTRAIHERYSPDRRNPWNEVECGDFYSRAMASFGVYLTVIGYDYHGPNHVLAMDPKLQADEFRTPVVFAEGWGTYTQRRNTAAMTVSLVLRHGKAKLRRLKVRPAANQEVLNVILNINSLTEICQWEMLDDGMVCIDLGSPVLLSADNADALLITLEHLDSWR